MEDAATAEEAWTVPMLAYKVWIRRGEEREEYGAEGAGPAGVGPTAN